MTIVIRATVITVSHTVTIAVLRHEEARPSKTTEQSNRRVHASLRSRRELDRTIISFFFKNVNIVDVVVVTHVERSTDLEIEAHRKVEHCSTSNLLHVELLLARFVLVFEIVPDKVISLEIHVEFTEEREEVKNVEFKSSAHEREGQECLVHGHAVTTVHVNEERHDINLGKVERQSATNSHNRLFGTEREGIAQVLHNEFRFTNPDTLLGVLGGVERISKECGEVDRNVCRNRSTSLNASRQVTNVTCICTIEVCAIAWRTLSRFQSMGIGVFTASGLTLEPVIVDRHGHTDIKVVQKTDSKTNVSADTDVISNLSLLAVEAVVHGVRLCSVASLEHIVTECKITQSCKHKLGMTKRLSRLCLIDTSKASLVYRIGMTSKGG